MALLYVLHNLKNTLQFNLQACHINHGVRGKEADLDEELVIDECSRLNIPLRTERLTDFNLNTSEDRLRQARYAKFQGILDDISQAKIATAHHLDDQLETFLMRLAKGSYLKGLTGIPVSRPGFIRPFLYLTREEIDSFVKGNNISFREDFTNKDKSKLRNKIRLDLIPVLISALGDDFYKGFEKSITDLKQNYDDLQTFNNVSFEKLVMRNEGILTFKRKDYQQLSDNRKRLFTEYCISMINPLNSSFAKYNFSEFNKFINSAHTGSIFYFNSEISGLKNRDEIRIRIGDKKITVDTFLNISEAIDLTDRVVLVERVKFDDVKFSDDKFTEYICGEHLKFPLHLRNWRPGDRFYSLGMKGKQKLSDYFINQKLSVDDKNSVLVLESGDEIVWILGLQIDNRFKISENCKQIYKLSQIMKKA